MAVAIIQPSFAAGELAPAMYGRVDVAKFHVGLSTCRNMYVNYRGGAYSRAGTKFVGFSGQTGRNFPPRLVTFQFNINQGLALEFGNLYMRVISNGAFVTETPVAITDITQADPGVVTSVGHPFVDDDWVYLTGILGMTELNGQTLIVDNATVNTFTLKDIYGNPIDTSAFNAYLSGGTAARIFTLTTPWAEEDLEYLKWTQSADVMSVCCWNQVTGTLYPPYELTRLADDNWTLTQFSTAATISPPAWCTGRATTAPSGGLAGADFKYVVTAVKTGGEESVASPIADIPNSADIALTAGSIELNWGGAAGAKYYNVYKAPPAYNSTVPDGAFYGYAGSTFGTSFVDSNVTPDFGQTPPTHTDPFIGGQILDVNITNPGSGLSSVTWGISTLTGSGFDGYPIISGGALTGFVITDPGQDYNSSDTISFNGAGFASGDITFSINPSPGDTVTLNGVVWTFVTAITAGQQTVIQGSLPSTLTQLAANVSSSGNSSLTVANYTATSTELVIIYGSAGTAGNSYTLAASVATPSGGTLTGGSGTGSPDVPTATLTISDDTGVFPSVVAYFQQRRVYASTPNAPDTYFFSQPGRYHNFDSRLPTVDSDAIIGAPWSVQVDGIQFMVPMPGGLVTLTGSSAWQLGGSGGSSLNPVAITPASQQAQPQAYNGCHATVPPIKIDYDINYVQAKGSILRDLAYNFFSNIYTGTDLTVLSSHLFASSSPRGSIREMAWCEEPLKIIWVVRTDGTLLSLTYLKAQEVMGWARHDTLGQWWSVCSVTEPPVDALYLVSQRFF